MGNMFFLRLKKENYDLRFSYVGYETYLAKDIDIRKEEKRELNIALKESRLTLDEVVVTEYKSPTIDKNKTTRSPTVTAEEIKSMPTKSVDEIAATSAGLSSDEGGDVSIRGSRTDATFYYVDGVRVAGDDLMIESAETMDMDAEAPAPIAPDMAIAESGFVAKKSSKRAKKKDMPKAGLLTAGEWNDLHNWEDWEKLQEEEGYRKFQDHWGFKPTTRYSTFITNEYELPLTNATVELLSATGKVIWTSMTDNAGKAELWADAIDVHEAPETIRVTHSGKKKTIKNIETIEDGSNHISLDVDCDRSAAVDIMFVVDATGSMSDEISYLQSELIDVLGRAKTENNKLDIRLGSVFYRDTKDEYLTRNLQLTDDFEEASTFLMEQRAGGGGDYPEAVEKGVEDALMQDWNEDAVAKLLFLVLDAPAS